MRIEHDNIFPNDIQIENSVLGALLASSEFHHLYIPLIIPEFFYSIHNKELFIKIKELYSDSKHIDLLTISNLLPDKVSYITKILIEQQSDMYLSEHIQVLTELYVKRIIAENCMSLICKVNEGELDDAINQLNSLEKQVNDVYSQFTKPMSIGELAEKSVNEAFKRVEKFKSRVNTGVPCPIAELKTLLGGWQNSDLIILAARPSMGKTAFALHCAKFAAERDVEVLFFSVEMDALKLTDRMITQQADLIPDNYRDGNLTGEELMLSEGAYYKLKDLPLSVVDRPDISIDQIRSISNALKPGLIIVDYLQIIKMAEVKNFNMVQEIGKITRKLKIIARELNVPVICLSQLNRSLESRGDKRPLLSDLRESGNIEQDADVVIFLYRDYVYSGNNQGEIEAIIGKHRNGRANFSISFKHNKYINTFFDKDITEKTPF